MAGLVVKGYERERERGRGEGEREREREGEREREREGERGRESGREKRGDRERQGERETESEREHGLLKRGNAKFESDTVRIIGVYCMSITVSALSAIWQAVCSFLSSPSYTSPWLYIINVYRGDTCKSIRSLKWVPLVALPFSAITDFVLSSLPVALLLQASYLQYRKLLCSELQITKTFNSLHKINFKMISRLVCSSFDSLCASCLFFSNTNQGFNESTNKAG